MASFGAVTAVSSAIVNLLESQYQPADFDDNQLDFQVYVTRNFATPMNAGVSVFLYRIYPNGSHRTPSGRVDEFGRRYRTQLPLDLHFLLTAWANEASLQHTIAGWMMRVLEDVPSFSAGLLNSTFDNVFHADETVEISLTELSTEELFRIWEVIGENAYQLSVPYVARTVRIESRRQTEDSEPVQTRVFSSGLVPLASTVTRR